jgi:hypothetical protein
VADLPHRIMSNALETAWLHSWCDSIQDFGRFSVIRIQKMQCESQPREKWKVIANK